MKGGWEESTDRLTAQQACSRAGQFREWEEVEAFEPHMLWSHPCPYAPWAAWGAPRYALLCQVILAPLTEGLFWLLSL